MKKIVLNLFLVLTLLVGCGSLDSLKEKADSKVLDENGRVVEIKNSNDDTYYFSEESGKIFSDETSDVLMYADASTGEAKIHSNKKYGISWGLQKDFVEFDDFDGEYSNFVIYDVMLEIIEEEEIATDKETATIDSAKVMNNISDKIDDDETQLSNQNAFFSGSSTIFLYDILEIELEFDDKERLIDVKLIDSDSDIEYREEYRYDDKSNSEFEEEYEETIKNIQEKIDDTIEEVDTLITDLKSKEPNYLLSADSIYKYADIKNQGGDKVEGDNKKNLDILLDTMKENNSTYLNKKVEGYEEVYTDLFTGLTGVSASEMSYYLDSFYLTSRDGEIYIEVALYSIDSLSEDYMYIYFE